MLSQRKAAASLPETIAGLSAAAQNKHRAARWSSLLLRVSLRAAARASVGVGVSPGFSDDSTAINTYINSALLCFLLSLVCADELYIIRAARAVTLMHRVLERSSAVHTLGCVASVTSGLHEIRLGE